MKLKNIRYETRKQITVVNSRVIETTSHHLFRVDDDTEIEEFRVYEEEIVRLADTTNRKKNLSANSINTYRMHVIKFIDYLHEAGVMGSDTALILHRAHKFVMSYPAYIQKELPHNATHEIETIRELMEGYRPKLGNNSINVHLNAVEHYIKISERHGRSAHTRLCRAMGVSPSESEYQPLFEQVWNSTEITQAQKLYWQNHTAIGAILGAHNIRGETNQVFSRRPSDDSPVRDKVAITQEQIEQFLNQESLSDRDRTLFALLFASGLRISEALLLQLGHIDFTQRRIFLPPNISKRGLTSEENKLCSAWKGRKTPHHEVNLFGVAEEIFWKSLDKLLLTMTTDYSHDFLFTFDNGKNKGRPFLLTQRADEKRGHTNIVTRFKKALREVGISEDLLHGPHFARHALVFYLHYECPRLTEDGELLFGYEAENVRDLIGHVSYTSTVNYKRDNSEKLRQEHKLSRDITRLNLTDQQAILLKEKNKHLAEARRIEGMLMKLEAHKQ
ncbi:tyrosine-type recombinase/integrase [Vibrio parahaemolyticus]|uniref:tyrosine-type recombinase/integrase n=1 Tax=Vibrio parahaemolyticus TaxID=670 RepID=UPI0015F698C5|nr:tyrosine-type recombinase/integrase [Vibrio parahaemolyticus]MBA5886181.1 tyrosine-type recombinase/integrase [Vibrio parahaemolyticus]